MDNFQAKHTTPSSVARQPRSSIT